MLTLFTVYAKKTRRFRDSSSIACSAGRAEKCDKTRLVPIQLPTLISLHESIAKASLNTSCA